MTQRDDTEQARRALTWAGRNGARRRHGAARTSQAGAAVMELTGLVHDRWLKPASTAAEALAPLVDESFRRHCRVVSATDGRVVIHVDAAAMVAGMRRRWVSVVREGMKSVDHRLATGAVVFEYGWSGVEVSLV